MQPRQRLRRLLENLREHYPELPKEPLPVLIEGAILCIPDFTRSILKAIAIHLSREIRSEEVKRFYLNASNEIIQVHHRAKRDAGRRKELKYLATPTSVADRP